MQRQRSRPLALERATCYRFFRSDSWELERRWRAVEILDDTIHSQMQKLEMRRQGRAASLRNIDAIRATIDNSLPNLQKYFKACERKAGECSRKYSTHEEYRNLFQEEVNDLKKEREFLERIRTELLDRLAGFSAAEKYLIAVKKTSQGQVGSVKDVIASFKQLEEERKTTFDHIEKTNSQIQEREAEWNNLNESDGQEQIHLLNYLDSIEDQKAKLEEKCSSLQQQFAKVHQLTADKCLNNGKLVLAYYNLYARLCSTLDPELYVESASTAEQTALIKIALGEIHKLRDNAHQALSPRSSVAIASSNSGEGKNSTTSVQKKKKQK